MGTAVLLHYQDEVTVRIRTVEFQRDGSFGQPSRSRSAMVQVNGCSLLLLGSSAPFQVLTELDALSNKKADTVATVLERVARTVGELVGGAIPRDVWSSGGGTLRKFVFRLVVLGDDVGTNLSFVVGCGAREGVTPVVVVFALDGCLR